ncbi:hypothetical protein DPMN_027891 [Dreissena polymorpha]|uniref:Uncharacterized protein n=1 Tax=Dreissena polymorpha TaxID=45954 RepID=A0A9D4LTQ6_DREPO|nr:hypothetical protein DPMN_027891 [Dreissena polymorpha]
MWVASPGGKRLGPAKDRDFFQFWGRGILDNLPLTLCIGSGIHDSCRQPFHDDWTKNVISRVHVIQLTGTIFELSSHIKETNVLTIFHENLAKNVTSRVFTCFHYIHIEKNEINNINKTNVLTNFHDWAKIVTSRVFTSHVIQLTGTTFELNSHIKETNVLTKFNDNWAKNVTSRVLTCFHYKHIEKNAPPTSGHVFSPIWTIFELVRDINKTNVLTNFLDWAKIVTSRKLPPPPPSSHVIQLTGTTFELNSHTKKTNVLTKFHENWAKNVTSRSKMPRPLAALFFSPIWTIFELVRDINKTNVLTNFHDDWAKNVTSRVFTSHVIQLTRTVLELNSHIKETNFLTKFHENLFTCFHYIHIEKNAAPTCGHVFSPIWTIFKLVRDSNKTNVLTNFHNDWAKIVAFRVLTRRTAPPTGGHVFQRTGITFELDQHIIKANILTNVYKHDPVSNLIIGTNLLTNFNEDRT